MKFSKSLNAAIEDTLPDWKDQFLSYKNLKKQLKLIYPKDGDKPPSKRPKSESSGDKTDGEVAKEVIDFVKLLEDEMEKFNSFIVEKEEDFVIKWKELQVRVERAKESNEELISVGREIVDFHGEMVLLENYSALNYTGLVKILKKYDKRSGALIRLPFIQKIMQQPFFTTHVLSKLISECETLLDRLFPKPESSIPSTTSGPEVKGHNSNTSTENKDEQPPNSTEVPKELSEIEYMESVYLKRTQSALQVLKEIRSGSSTVNMFSLPPLQSNAVEGWKKVPAVEQAAE